MVEVDGVLQPGPAPRLSGHPVAAPGPAPVRGGHTREVLAAAGLDVDALLASGAARQA